MKSHLFRRRAALAMLLGLPLGLRALAQPARQSPKIGVAYTTGGKGDQAYNDAAARGTETLRSQGFDILEFEPAEETSLERGLDLLSNRARDLILCIGPFYDNVIDRPARRNPKTTFILFDGTAARRPNVTGVEFDTFGGSFLAGSAAAAQSTTKKVGFIGGLNIPLIEKFRTGFEQGAQFTDPQVTISTAYIGGPNPFRDAGRAAQLARSLLANQADVLFHASGASGVGIITAAREAGVTVIGVDVDQSHLAPETVLTSMLKNFDKAMVMFTSRYVAGDLPGATSVTIGLRDGAVGLAKLADFAKPSVAAAVETARAHLLKT